MSWKGSVLATLFDDDHQHPWTLDELIADHSGGEDDARIHVTDAVHALEREGLLNRIGDEAIWPSRTAACAREVFSDEGMDLRTDS